jgi:membrane associated rhomboid family serine protease
MLENLATELQQLAISMQINMFFALKLVGILWLVHIINWMTKYHLNPLGIRPRSVAGLPGIVFAPLLHANFGHLFFNSIPLFVLSDLILPEGKITFYYISGTIILLSGLLTWLFGKRGIHIGASSLIMGYFGYLLSQAYFHLTATTVMLAGFCIYYFGGLFFSLVPGMKKNVSWEGHIFGFLSGIFTSYYLEHILGLFGF